MKLLYRTNWEYLLIGLVLFIGIFLTFGKYKEKTRLTEADFFTSQQFNGDFYSLLPPAKPDSEAILIHVLVPDYLQLAACQNVYYKLDEDASISFRLQHLDIFDQYFKFDSLHAFTQMIRGELYIEMARFEEAEACLEQSRQLSLKLKDVNKAADAQRFQARAILLQGGYPEAVNMLLEVYDVYAQNLRKDLNPQFNVCIDLGNAYREGKDFREALKWNMEALRFVKARVKPNSSDLTGFLTIAYEQVAQNYLELMMPDSALYFAKASLEVRQKHNNNYDVTTSHHLLSQIYLAKNEYEQALQYVKKAQNSNVQKENKIKELHILKTLGDVYVGLGRLDSALYYLKQCLVSRDTGLLAVLHEQLSNIALKQGNYGLALAEMTESRKDYNVAFNVEKSKILTYQNVRFQLAQKEQHIEKIENEHKNAHLLSLLYLVGLSLSIVIVVLLYTNQIRKSRFYIQEKELFAIREKLQLQALEQSQQALQSQEAQLRHSTLLLELKNQMIAALEMQLTNAGQETLTPIQHEKDLRRMRILTDADWQHFLERFEQITPGFVFRLKAAFPTLTLAETRLFLLVKLYFDSREISDATGISQESVWRGRHRLRKKLGLSEQVNLDEYIQSF